MNQIKTFFCEPTGRVRGWLRRYSSGSKCNHPSTHGYHDAHVLVVPDAPSLFEEGDSAFKHFPKEDHRWPKHCACGYEFGVDDSWQYMTRSFYRRLDTGEVFVMRPPGERVSAPLGAMWDANWDNDEPGLDRQIGPDRMRLQVVLPTGEGWSPDARAGNCGSPCKHCKTLYRFHKKETCTNPGDGVHTYTIGAYEDSRPQHYCWIRHGDPRTGNVHVDKNGDTCDAGAGSILANSGWHGFLHNGFLRP